MKPNNFYVPIFILLFFSTIVFAHEGEEHQAQQDTFTVVNGDTIAVNGETYQGTSGAEAIGKNSEEFETEDKGSYNPTWKGIFTEHIHNKIIHFPIAFAVGAFILTLVGFKEDKYEIGIKWLVVLAGLAAIIGYFSGIAQEEAFEGTAKEWVIEIHETMGIVSLITIWIWAVFLYAKPLKKYAWIVGLVLTLIILITAAYGGMLAHG